MLTEVLIYGISIFRDRRAFMAEKFSNHSLTFDDVLLRPGLSEVFPHQVDTSSLFSRNIKVHTPLVSAAMDTVTEADTAIVMGQEGGIGVIHKNLSAEDQAKEVSKVKKYETGMILNPITVGPDWTLSHVIQVTSKHNITGVPVVDETQRLVGILTSRDIRFETQFSRKVKDVMTPKEKLICAKKSIDSDKAKAILHKHRIEKLPVVDDEGKIIGLITIKDILRTTDYPNACRDELGRLRVAAAVGVGRDEHQRVELLIEAGADALVVDTAHGHSTLVISTAAQLKKKYPHVDIVAGNVATKAAALALIKAGVDAIKVGIGAGSICTTRVVTGVGVPQLAAVMDCASVCSAENVPLISDGGTKYSGDIVKALAAGADTVMIGSLFAGTDESPGEMILYKGRSYKVYRGMGSMGAMAVGKSKDRYFQEDIEETKKLVPEGIEGQVPYRGDLSTNIFQLMGGLRAGMGYVGAKDLDALRKRGDFIQITSVSLRESHPHDIMITKEAPNYSVSHD